VNRLVATTVAFLSASVIVLALASCSPEHDSSKEKSAGLPAAAVRVQTVQSKPQVVIEEVVGTVRAKLRATLEPKLSGRIASLPVVLGDHIKAGELVARLDTAEIMARLGQAEAALEQAARDWQRTSALFEQQAATRAEYDAAQSRHRIAEAVSAEAKAMMDYAQVVAPFDGVVTAKWANEGDLAAPGKPLISIEDPTALQLEADVPAAMATLVQRGSMLAVRVDDISAELPGLVSEIATGVDPLTRTFQVKVDLPEQAGLNSGQFGRLLVPVGESNLLRVPASAVVQRGQMEIVFVLAGHTARLHLVKTGKHIGDETEILSGLHAGDVVVVAGAARLTDGQAVDVK